ncbi:FUSC family protein [Dyella sp. KRB-257]|uniref:FUSC family protein n=1 Tax=Dyella sp. KRB-257 TaxID=3400915 RepID=UPI003C068992
MCGTVVHAVVFPVSTARILRARLAAALQDAQAVCIDALAADDAGRTAPDRRKLATAINELHELLLHARYEGTYLRGQLEAIQWTLALVERIMPLSLAVDDRLSELARLDPLQEGIEPFLRETQSWFAAAAEEPRQQMAQMQRLQQHCDALRPAIAPGLTWRDALTCNLLDRVRELIALKGAILRLRDRVEGARGPAHPTAERSAALVGRRRWRPMERDWRGAAGASLAVMATVFVGNAAWIASGWLTGYSAVMMAGVYFSIYSATPDPSQMLKNKFVGVVLRLLLGMVYVVLILPAISDFGALVLAMAPALLLSGLMMGTPRFSAMGFNFVVGVFSPNIIDRSFHADFQLYLNAGIATLIGIYYAMLMVSLTRFLWVDGMVRRTLAAGRRDIASLRHLSPAAQPLWRSRMAHRIGLLTLRMASSPTGGPPEDALRDMMTGGALAQLHAVSQTAPAAQQKALQALVHRIAEHYRALQRAPQLRAPPALHEQIDHCLTLVLATAEIDPGALSALTSLRRNLFPEDHSAPAGMGGPDPAHPRAGLA